MNLSGDEFSDDDCLMKKCFDVTIPDDFDPDKCPTTGEEYLQLAMYEAKQCQATVRVDVDYKKLVPHPPVDVPYIGPEYPKIVLPLAWKTEKLFEFTRFYKYIQKELQQMPPKRISFDDQVWQQRLTQKPIFSEATKLDPYNQMQLFDMILKELENIRPGSMMSDTLGCWIYTLLSLLQIPLEPSFYCKLRDLAKKCSEIRYKLGTPANLDELCTSLNLFICIIGLHYQQYDLADNYV